MRTAVTTAACMLLSAVIISACKSKHDAVPSPPPKPVYFSKNWKADVGFSDYGECAIMRAENGELIAFLPTNDSLLQSTSMDNGKSWTPPKLIYAHHGSIHSVLVSGRLLGVVTLETVAGSGQIYFQTRADEHWNEPSPIRDTNRGGFSNFTFATDSLDNLYCAWEDWREGNRDIYFSASFDGGKTWSPNVRINDDQTGQEQGACVLLSTSGGVLYGLWEDNRNAKTLFDIYCSTSHDGGKTWSDNVRVNDDTTHTFQIKPSAVLDTEGNLYAAWRDYRDKGATGDINANIYFARSEDGGKSWRPNIRISHAQYGHNWFPLLALTSNGQLHCTWLNSEDNPSFDVFHSYSPDSGQTWSQPTRVNDDLDRVSHYHRSIGWLGPDPKGNIVIGWRDHREGQLAVYLAQALDHPDTARPERKPQRTVAASEPKLTLSVEPGDTLFHDNFAEGPSPQWKVESGTWVCKEQTYIGYGTREARSVVGKESWSDYIFSGRFQLDPLDHRAACLFLRVSKDKHARPNYYRLTNYFRQGVRLEYFNGNSFLLMVEAPYPFQKDRWYAFRTVVKGGVLNHFIDDSLVMTTDQLIHIPRGKVGIGASYSPTYFKDILVTTVK